jgi:hypothetical protein
MLDAILNDQSSYRKAALLEDIRAALKGDYK